MSTRLTINPTEDSCFSGLVSPLPGCPDVAISHAMFKVCGESGLATKAGEERDEAILNSGYSAILCTVEAGNTKQVKTLINRGWVWLGSFVNLRTGNTVNIWMKTS